MADQSEPLDLEIDPKEFRTVLGHFPTGVTVVAGVDDEGAHGLAVGSFFSVSLAPPLVGFCVGCESRSWARISRIGRFSVNVLSEHQSEISNTLALRSDDKFSGIDWFPSPVTGSPWITDAVAHIDCCLEHTYAGGDHSIIVGRVRTMQLHRSEHGPLIFLKGAYGRHVDL